MRQLSVPLSTERIQSVLDFLDRELTRQRILTAPRLCLLAAVEELFFAALALRPGRGGHMRCGLEPSGAVRLSFRSRHGPILPEREQLYLPEQLSLRSEGSSYILTSSPEQAAAIPECSGFH